jgi:hypothetical protein
MKKDWRKVGEVTLVNAYNRTHKTYHSLEDAVRGFSREIIDGLGDRPLGHYWDVDWGHNRIHSTWMGGERFVIYDELGLRVPAWRIKEAWHNLPTVWEKPWRWYGGRRRWRGNRSPKVAQTHRYFSSVKQDVDELQDHNVHLKTRRSSILAVDPWDDWPQSDWRIRSWKKYRRTQYKTVDRRFAS